MLSANSEMSNIFLQRGQNIDIADKNPARPLSELWKPAGINVLFSLTKRSAFQGRARCLKAFTCPFYCLRGRVELVGQGRVTIQRKVAGRERGFSDHDSQRNRIL
jgi:hypothetical protein